MHRRQIKSRQGGAEDVGAVTNCLVMAGLVTAIHGLLYCTKDVDARHKAGHDASIIATSSYFTSETLHSTFCDWHLARATSRFLPVAMQVERESGMMAGQPTENL